MAEKGGKNLLLGGIIVFESLYRYSNKNLKTLKRNGDKWYQTIS
jgi:hypothetical protein